MSDIERDGRTWPERWRAAAIQAKNDLRAIEEAFRIATPIGEDGPNPPLGPGCVFADWTSPANTMRWVEEMETMAPSPHGQDVEALDVWLPHTLTLAAGVLAGTVPRESVMLDELVYDLGRYAAHFKALRSRQEPEPVAVDLGGFNENVVDAWVMLFSNGAEFAGIKTRTGKVDHEPRWEFSHPMTAQEVLNLMTRCISEPPVAPREP